MNQKQVQVRLILSCYRFHSWSEESDSVQAVITAPSRELATQIYQAARQIAAHSDVEIRVANYVGGTDKARQIDKLASNQPHIVIGTPGRIYDLVKSGDLAIHKAKTFVVDEADMTLDMGFLETVDKIAGSLPKDLQFMVFSATIPQKLQSFFEEITCQILSWRKSRLRQLSLIPLTTG